MPSLPVPSTFLSSCPSHSTSSLLLVPLQARQSPHTEAESLLTMDNPLHLRLLLPFLYALKEPEKLTVNAILDALNAGDLGRIFNERSPSFLLSSIPILILILIFVPV